LKTKPQLSKKASSGVTHNQVRSNCKLCPDPVLVGEPAQFVSDPVGLSHTACIEAYRTKLAAAVVVAGSAHQGRSGGDE
jgi:hypothetical protein